MSKALLVMDMPSSCDKCPLFNSHYSDMTCRANGKGINYPYPKENRQNWCPLKPMPEKANHPDWCDGGKYDKYVFEVEEKPKTYIEKGQYNHSRILKSDVGVLSGYDRCALYLLEDDIKKAESMFIELLKKKIEIEKQRIENITESCNRNITEYENCIAELLK